MRFIKQSIDLSGEPLTQYANDNKSLIVTVSASGANLHSDTDTLHTATDLRQLAQLFTAIAIEMEGSSI